MNTLHHGPYRYPSDEELQAFKRRAHAERAEAMRSMLAALLAWARRAPAKHPAVTGANVAACH